MTYHVKLLQPSTYSINVLKTGQNGKKKKKPFKVVA